MRSARAIFLLPVTVATALAVTGCASNTSDGSGGTPTASAPPSASASEPPASASTTPSVPAVASPTAASSPASAVPSPPPSSAPVSSAPEPVTFTFPDGRLSFALPAGWRVYRDGAVESPVAENATVYDAGGNEQVRIFYSEVGGAVTGPLTRTVFYSEPVPGLRGHSGPVVAHASFFVDNIDGEPHYRMALTAGAAVSPAGGAAADVVIVGGNRVLAATVVFTGGPFASDEAAQAWFAGEEGQALKALLMSFTYR